VALGWVEGVTTGAVVGGVVVVELVGVTREGSEDGIGDDEARRNEGGIVVAVDFATSGVVELETEVAAVPGAGVGVGRSRRGHSTTPIRMGTATNGRLIH
jgi:hypothetical protein